MTHDEMKREAKYQATMCLAKKMLSQGLITLPEYQKVEEVFLEKYSPIFGVLFSSPDENFSST